MKEKWTKDIHDRLVNYEKEAPEGLWNSIRSNMPQMENTEMHRQEHRHVFLYTSMRRMTTVAAAACMALIIGYKMYNNGGDTPIPLAKMSMMRYANKSVVKNVVKNVVKKESECGLTEHGNQEFSSLLASVHTGLETEVGMGSGGDATHDVPFADTTRTISSADDVRVLANDEKRQDGMATKLERTNKPRAYYAPDNRNAGEPSSRWSISAGAMSSVGSSLTVRSVGQKVTAAGPDGSEWADNPMLGIGVLNQGKDIITETRHRLPVRIGMNVAYAATKRISIESGLTYTRLSSDIREGTKDNFFYGEQQLDYVGVPVNVKYRFAGFRRFGIYASAGLLAEKCVSGKTTMKYVIMGETRDTEQQKISEKPLQMSVNAAIGAQYDVMNNICIYAEPGLSYYFDDGSSLKSIYKDKPLNFSLNIGIRVLLGK